MNEWKAYWPIYERIEGEFCDLSFSIAFTDDQMKVHSSRVGDLLVRACSECENVGKAVCAGRGKPLRSQPNFPEILDAVGSAINLQPRELLVVWPYQSLTSPSLRPFSMYVSGVNKNPPWFDAHNDAKHNRATSPQTSSVGNLVQALGALFILNLALRQKEITAHSEPVELARARVNSYSRFFSPASFLQLASVSGISVSGGVSTTQRSLVFDWK